MTYVRAQNVAIAGIALWATVPYFAYGDGYRVVVLVLAGLWLLLEGGRRHGLIRRPTRWALGVLLYSFYILGVEMAVPGGKIVSLAQEFIFLFFCLVLESRRNSIASLRPVFWTVLIASPVWMYQTYLALGVNQDYARMLAHSSLEAVRLSAEGIGGYGQVYLSALLVPALLSLLLSRVARREVGSGRISRLAANVLVSAVLVLSVLVVLRAGYSLAVYAMLAGAILVLVFAKARARRAPVIFLFLAFALVPMAAMLPQLLGFLEELSSGTLYARKFADLSSSLAAGSVSGTLEGRTDQYLQSVRMFMSHPLMGVLDPYRVGGHSAVLDHLGRYGIIAGGFFMVILARQPLHMIRAQGVGFGLSLAFSVSFAIICTFNTVAGAFGVAVFLMVPVVWDILFPERSMDTVAKIEPAGSGRTCEVVASRVSNTSGIGNS